LSQDLGREPNGQELAEELDVTPHEVADAGSAYGSFSPTSLDQPVNADGASHLSDLLPDDDTDAHASEARLLLAPALRKLSDRDRRILYLRYCEDRTQQEIGDDIGVTQMQVSRTLTRILRDLRTDLDDG
ncbi:sigma-70 family RNA polymerase sigma factor, partial [Nocardioides guangzhouensis]